MKEKFKEQIEKGYAVSGDYITFGAPVLDGETYTGVQVKASLRMLNRHGLIAGATGTGKTKTLQGFCEALSSKGISSLVLDIKGDFSGISQAGVVNDKIKERHTKIGKEWKEQAFPVEFLSISGEKGVPMRATVLEFGPVLFSKILELNDTQSGVVSLVFKYSDDRQLPLLDLKDFKKVLHYLTNEGKKEIEENYGKISTASSATILRKIVEIEQQGAEHFFGERSFEVEDLIRVSEEGKGIINILRVMDMQDKPKLFSTFMLSLLAEIYATFPEEGDLEHPKLCLFIDEAHLIFSEASSTLLNQLETIIKLIRSKGIGVFFCTQSPMDIPAPVLAQLGLKVQHALRAFTAADRTAIKQTAENYPLSDFYKVDELLTSLGIGEALITCLSEKGTPCPVVHTLLCAPQSRMDTISDAELAKQISNSDLVKKYSETIDRNSAFEMLNNKIAQKDEEIGEVETAKEVKTRKAEKSTLESVMSSPVAKQVARSVASSLTRGLLGALGLGTTRRSSKRNSFF